MEHDLTRYKIDLEEQLNAPWNWVHAHYRHMDGWEINKNRIYVDQHLQEMSTEFGPITIPHRQR